MRCGRDDVKKSQLINGWDKKFRDRDVKITTSFLRWPVLVQVLRALERASALAVPAWPLESLVLYFGLVLLAAEFVVAFSRASSVFSTCS